MPKIAKSVMANRRLGTEVRNEFVVRNFSIIFTLCSVLEPVKTG